VIFFVVVVVVEVAEVTAAAAAAVNRSIPLYHELRHGIYVNQGAVQLAND